MSINLVYFTFNLTLNLFNSINKKESQFKKLPDEAILHIFSFLNRHEINIVSLVDKRFQNLSCKNVIWIKFLPKELLEQTRKKESSGTVVWYKEILISAAKVNKRIAEEFVYHIPNIVEQESPLVQIAVYQNLFKEKFLTHYYTLETSFVDGYLIIFRIMHIT